MRKNLGMGLAVVFIILMIYLLVAVFFIEPKIDTAIIKHGAFIEYPAEYNYRQSKNDCGPFNTAAVMRALTGTDIDSALFAKEIGWRLPNKYTLPRGLESQLKKQGLHIKKPNFWLLTDEEKIELTQEYISVGMPIIILGERDKYEHYMTIFGFNADVDQYYMYDSLQVQSPEQKNFTIDENGAFPGNKTMTTQELLDFWRGGGMYGLWKWYGLVVSL